MDDEVGVANDAAAEVGVADVPHDEVHSLTVPVAGDEVGDVIHVPRVRQLVQDREPRPGEHLSQVLGYVGADEPAAPSHHDLHCIVSSSDHTIGQDPPTYASRTTRGGGNGRRWTALYHILYRKRRRAGLGRAPATYCGTGSYGIGGARPERHGLNATAQPVHIGGEPCNKW